MQINPYLSFNGNCREAFKFYEGVFGAKTSMSMTWGESPMCDQMPKEMSDHIMHTTLNIGNAALMGADAPAEHYEKPQGMHIALHYEDTAEGERIFNALSEGGTVQMPFQKTFWADGFGMCADKFGIPWMVNCGQGTGD